MASDRLIWLGHASVLLELDGARLLTDPVLRGRVAHLRRHAPPAADTGALDAVLVSHAHRDHLDLPTLRALRPAPRQILVPRGVGRLVRAKTSASVHELTAGETAVVGAVTVRAVPAVHDGRRSPFSGPSESIGFVVEAGGRRIYFAGDTAVYPGMRDLGPLDVALLPIWGWGPSLGPGHMNPSEAVDALELLRPAVAVPIHWGTLLPIGLLRHRGRVLRAPVEVFTREARERCPEVRVAVLGVGDPVAL
ncbi:MAG: MBL fold metallo-hydrolase [Solirubrobacteraceae bacterium]